MENIIETDLCIIGAGSSGLSMAAGAAQMGASVVLVEADKMGGDCLNYGCVPSKSLLAIARALKNIRKSETFGIEGLKPEQCTVNFQKARQYMHHIMDTLSEHDSVERFTKLGVRVIKGTAQFINKRQAQVQNTIIQPKQFVIATGASAAFPPVAGLNTIPYLTNKTLFDIETLPQHLIVLGGGPLGCEMAQAFRLLDAKVSIIQRSRVLSKDEPECAAVVKQQLLNDGIVIYEETKLLNVAQDNSNITVAFEYQGKKTVITGSHLLVAAGRKPNIENLNLEAAGVKATKQGIIVNQHLRTTNKRILAIGDVTGGYQFTPVANYHASVALRNALFCWPLKSTVHYEALPWCTYTEPELAHIGLLEKEAAERYKNIRVLQKPFTENDRAQIEGDPSGFIKLIATKKGRVLGVSIVGHGAGELIMPWGIAISKKLPLHKLAELIVPYPTRSEINKHVAGEFYMPLLFSPFMKKLVRFLQKLR